MCSSLTWETLPQLAVITPGDVLEITAYSGREVEELAEYLEERYPGILQNLCERYLRRVLASMPPGVIPPAQEVRSLTSALASMDHDECTIRLLVAEHFSEHVDSTSPKWAIRAMMATIEHSLGNSMFALREAGFAENELADPEFEAKMDRQADEVHDALLAVERHKAEELIPLIYEERAAKVQ